MADTNTRWRIEATSNLPELNDQIERLIKLQMEQNALTQQTATATVQAINQQREAFESLANSQTKTNASAKQQTDMVGTLRKEYDLLSKQLNGIINLAAGAFVVGQLKTYIDEIIRAKSAQDGFVASMEQMMGSRLRAEELNSKLMEIATKSPFTIEQIQEVTKKLQGMGVETSNLIPYINMLGDIASVVGTQKLPLIAKALTDVQNKGILMGGEIKQFTENGIPLFDLLAKSMEKPRAEITKLADAHKITFADVEKALMQATEKGGLYYNQMAVQAEQLGGKVANLSDKFTLGKAKIGDYFENGIKKGIETLSDFIDATIGSASAIARTTQAFEVAASVYALYRVAVISVNAALQANKVETLSALAAKEADTVATVSMTTATTGLRTTMTGLWTAMRANPIGAVLTLVTALYTAYQVWELSTMDVISALGEEEIKLKNSQALLVGSVEATMKMAEGTQERTKSINQLISKYPEYFSGLNAERTSNATLKNILDSVNISYAQRIDLARQAYTLSELEKKRSELLKDEFELMELIKSKSPELYAQVQGDSQKLLDAIQKGGNAFLRDLEDKGSFLKDLWYQVTHGGGGLYAQVKDVAEGLKKVDTEIIDASQRRAKIAEQEQKAAISLENARWVEVEKQLKKGSNEYQEALTAHEKTVRDISGETTKIKIKNEDEVVKKKKSTLELSLENDLKELKSMEQTYMVRLMYLDKEEQLKKEQAKRQITDTEDEQERILSIEKQYNLKRNALITEYALKNMKEATKWFTDEYEAFQKRSDKIFALREAEQLDWEKHQKAVQKLSEQISDKQKENAEQQAEYDAYYNAIRLADERKFWQDKELVVAQGLNAGLSKQLDAWYKEREDLRERAEILKDSVLRQEEYKNILLQIEELNAKIAKGEKEHFENSRAIAEKKIGQAKEIFSLMSQAFSTLSNSQSDSLLESIDATAKAVKSFYNAALEANEESFKKQVANTRLSLGQIEDIFQEYADRQRTIFSNAQDFEEYSRKMKKMVADAQEMTQQTQKFTELLAEGKWVGAIISGLTSIVMASENAKKKKHQDQIEMLQNDIDMAEYEKQLIEQNLEVKINALQRAYDAEIKRWNEKEDHIRAVFDREIQATKDHYAELLALEQQRAEDSKNLINASDVYRSQLADQWLSRQLSDLKAERDRNLVRAQSEKDYLDIWNYYQGLMADANTKYEQGKVDKSVQTAIANEELASQSADAVTKNKEQEANAINDLQDQLQKSLEGIAVGMYNAQLKMEQAIVKAKQESANAQMMIDYQIFEAQKKMAVAEMQFAINKMMNQANPNVKAITEMRVAMAEIQNTPNPFTGVASGGVTDESGRIRNNAGKSNIQNNYQDAGTNINRPNNNSNGQSNHDVKSNNGGDRGDRDPGFHGSPWLRRQYGESYGIDEINMNVHEGERLIPSYLNQFLGEKLTNEKLVHGYMQYANFQDRLPSLALPDISPLVLPDFSGSNQSSISMERVEKKLDQLNKTFANKSLLNVNIDANRVTVSEQWNQHKVNYYNTLFNG